MGVSASQLEGLKEQADRIGNRLSELADSSDESVGEDVKEAIQELADALGEAEDALGDLADATGTEVEWGDE